MRGVCSACGIKTFLVLTIISTALLIVSLVVALKIVPDVIESLINKNVRLDYDTEQMDRFLELPFPLYFKVYIFNVENAEDVLNKGEKPRLKEIGPYVYQETRKKTVEGVSKEEDSISYREQQVFTFDADASGDLKDDDIVTVLNPALLSLIQLAEDFGEAGLVLADCMDEIFAEHKALFIDIPVKQILFEGLNFCKLSLGKCLFLGFPACLLASTLRNVDHILDGSLNFTFFNFKVKTDDGLYTVQRGLDDITTLGNILRLDGSSYTSYWGGNGSKVPCDHIKGTDSTIYPPHVTKDSVFSIYSTDICRYVDIHYQGEGSYKGIDGYRFGVGPDTLRSNTEDPADDCYCSKRTGDIDGQKSCFLDGLIDLQPCIGVPVLLSFPHFLWADEKYRNGVEGMEPHENSHETYLLIEPNTGTPLQGFKRVQMSVVIRPIPGFNVTENLPRTVLPLIWLEEGISLTDKYIDMLDDEYFGPKKAADIGQWFFVGISALLTVIFGGLLIKTKFF